MKDEANKQRGQQSGQGPRGVGGDRGSAGPSAGPDHSQDRFSSQRGASQAMSGEAPGWKGSGNKGGPPHRGGNDTRHGGQEAGGSGGRGWGAPKPNVRATVRCSMVPSEIGPVELSQHFAAFGKIVDMRLRTVLPEEGGNGEKEALLQFASARQAQACVAVSVCFPAVRLLLLVCRRFFLPPALRSLRFTGSPPLPSFLSIHSYVRLSVRPAVALCCFYVSVVSPRRPCLETGSSWWRSAKLTWSTWTRTTLMRQTTVLIRGRPARRRRLLLLWHRRKPLPPRQRQKPPPRWH